MILKTSVSILPHVLQYAKVSLFPGSSLWGLGLPLPAVNPHNQRGQHWLPKGCDGT